MPHIPTGSECTITCDQCGTEIVLEGIDYTGDFLSQINALLEAEGWIAGPPRDVCPECTVKKLKGGDAGPIAHDD